MKLVEIQKGGISKILPSSKIGKYLAWGYTVVEPQKKAEKKKYTDLQLKAKAAGVKSWHMKSEETLLKELGGE